MKRNRIGGQFAARLIEMLESPAYRVLSLSARRVMDRIEIELGHHGGTDNGKLPVTYDDFEKYGIDRHAIAPAIREAAALGFIEVTRPGRAGNAEWRLPALYRLTYAVTKDVPTTHEWRKITDLTEAAQIAKTARTQAPKRLKPSEGKTTIVGGGKPTSKCRSQGAKPPLLSQ